MMAGRLLAIALVSISILAGWMASLVLDQTPPFDQARGRAEYAEVHPGDRQLVSWNFVEPRFCQDVRAYRSLRSEADPNWAEQLSDRHPVMDPLVPRPRFRLGSPVDIRVPDYFPMNADGSPTRAFYAVDGRAACNWLQEWLPERLRVHFTQPAVEFLVTRP